MHLYLMLNINLFDPLLYNICFFNIRSFVNFWVSHTLAWGTVEHFLQLSLHICMATGRLQMSKFGLVTVLHLYSWIQQNTLHLIKAVQFHRWVRAQNLKSFYRVSFQLCFVTASVHKVLLQLEIVTADLEQSTLGLHYSRAVLQCGVQQSITGLSTAIYCYSRVTAEYIMS